MEWLPIDWHRLDREPVKTIHALAATLAREKVRELLKAEEEKISGPIAMLVGDYQQYRLQKETDRICSKLAKLRLDYLERNMLLLAQGIRTKKILPVHNNLKAIQAYFDEVKRNEALYNRLLVERVISTIPDQRPARLQAQLIKNDSDKRKEAMLKQYYESMPKPLPPLLDEEYSSHCLPQIRVDKSQKISLLIEIGDIEIIPSEAVRWMVETNEGEEILPDGLKKFLNLGQLHEGIDNTEKLEIDNNIEAWQRILDKVKGGKDQIAAQLAISLWKGLTSAEAFDALQPPVFVNDKVNKVNYVRKRRDRAARIAEEHGLHLPMRWVKEVSGEG